MTLLAQAVLALLGGGLVSGVVALALLPRQKRQLDAATAKTVIDAAKVMVDELQEEVAAARKEARAARAEAGELRKALHDLQVACRTEIDRLRDENGELRLQLAHRNQ